MRYYSYIFAALLPMLMLSGPSWAGGNDYNPAYEGGREVFKHIYNTRTMWKVRAT